MSSTPSSIQDHAVESVCAAMDGDASALDAVARAWKADASVRATWHTYQLIGDALRSSDCAGSVERDAALLARVRERLVQEPVVLAPAAAGRVKPSGAAAKRWIPTAMAAGVAVAAVGWVVLQPGAGQSPTAAEISAGVAPAAAIQTTVVPAAMPATVLASDGVAASAVMIRSVELDRYLAAHQQFANTSAVPAPGLVVRSVSTTVSPAR